MSEPFDPYQEWLGIPPEDQPPNHYRLLGINLYEDAPEVIEPAADQCLCQIESLQTEQHGHLVYKLRFEIETARTHLLDNDLREEYNFALRVHSKRPEPKVAAPLPPGLHTPGSTGLDRPGPSDRRPEPKVAPPLPPGLHEPGPTKIDQRRQQEPRSTETDQPRHVPSSMASEKPVASKTQTGRLRLGLTLALLSMIAGLGVACSLKYLPTTTAILIASAAILLGVIALVITRFTSRRTNLMVLTGIVAGLGVFMSTWVSYRDKKAVDEIVGSGISWHEKGQYEKAILDFTEAIRLNPTDAKNYTRRGLSWFEKGKYDQAIADCTQAIRLNPKLSEAYLRRGEAWEKRARMA